MKTSMLACLLALVVPGIAIAAEVPAKSQTKVASGAAPTGPLDLNSASEDELVNLPGIGPSKARAIVAYRQKTRFQKVEDLLKVRGIGRSIFRQVREQVTVRDSGRTRADASRPSAKR